MRASGISRQNRQKSGYAQTALVLQGGGALGAYTARRFFNAVSTGASVLAGQPGFFQPRLPWRSGYEDGKRTLEQPLWSEPAAEEDGVRIFDVAGATTSKVD